jgi:CcmD family protein
VRWRTSRWRVAVLLLLLSFGAVHDVSLHAQQPPRAAQDEFVPIDQLPPDEKLPAARLLIAAYSVAWILIAGYLWSIWQRLDRVEREMGEVTRRLEQTSVAQTPKDSGGRGSR